MGYVGSAPAGVQLTGSDAVFVFTASGGETSVTTADSGASVVYEPGFVSVFVNGVRFVEGDDYTASTGSGVSLTSALNGGDVVVVVASDTRALDDAVPRSGGSFAGGVDFLGGLDSTTVTASGDITSNGETVYHRGNVVGTVSQSGGTPTGAVIERDENANGEYVKFADGTLICWDNFEPVSLNQLSIGDGLVRMAHTNNEFTFAAPFSAQPSANINLVNDSMTFTHWIGDLRGLTTTEVAFELYGTETSLPSDLTVLCVAVGRWY